MAADYCIEYKFTAEYTKPEQEIKKYDYFILFNEVTNWTIFINETYFNESENMQFYHLSAHQ